MVGFDVPAVTNDMIMRFMGVDIKELGGPTGAVDSKVGDDERPAVHFGAYPETVGIPLLKGGKSDWECKSCSPPILSSILSSSLGGMDIS